MTTDTIDLLDHETIDLEKAREILRRAVEKHGVDFRYRDDSPGSATCLYVTREYAKEHWGINPVRPANSGRDGFACIVGTGLDEIGETWHHAEKFWDQSIFMIAEDYPDLFSEEAKTLLGKAQESQDFGSTWGDAAEAGERAVQDLLDARAYATTWDR